MLLHAPIGLLIGLVTIEVLSVISKKPLAREVRQWMAWLVVVTVAGSIATGLVLRREGGYGSDTVDWHQWLGISLGVVCLIAAAIQQFGKVGWYRLMLGMVAALVIPVGHYGASLTHGSEFLTEVFSPASSRIEPTTTLPVGDSEYATVIAPILQLRCAGCHNEKKSKGNLRLDTPDGIEAGSDLGAVLVAMKPDESELLKRMKLPIDSDDHMPPKSKPQPDAKEIEAIASWIARGASFTEPLGAGIDSVPANQAAKPIVPAPLKNADPAAIESLQAALVHVSPVSQGSNLLLVDFAAVSNKIDDAEFARLLEPIAANIEQLNAARTKISDAAMAVVAKMKKLKKLDIGFTAISESGLAHLQKDQPIEELVIAKSMVGDALSLENLPALKRMFCWGSKIGTERIAQLKQDRSGLFIDNGESAQAALETEPTPVLAATPKPASTAPPASDLKPVNTICPVSGKPVDPTKLVVYKGQVVAMCCEHCAEAFLADPEKFASKIVK